MNPEKVSNDKASMSTRNSQSTGNSARISINSKAKQLLAMFKDGAGTLGSASGRKIRASQRTAILGAAALVVIVAAISLQKFMISPTRAVDSKIGATAKSITDLESQLATNDKVLVGLRSAANSTLGGTLDEVSHQFRARLSALAEAGKLSQIVVDQRSGEPMTSPIATARGLPQSLTLLRSSLRKKPDFIIIRGTLKGQGSLQDSLALLGTIQAQDWVHRVEGFSIKPLGKERERVEISIDVSTLFLPDLVKKDYAQPSSSVIAQASQGLVARIAERDPFRYPSPEVVVAVQTPQQPARVPSAPVVEPPAYHEWRVAGVMLGSRGAEVIVVNGRTNESLSLSLGGKVLGATLVECRVDVAVFEIEGTKFIVQSGESLGARRPDDPVHSIR